jgi:hypothetical protein
MRSARLRMTVKGEVGFRAKVRGTFVSGRVVEALID